MDNQEIFEPKFVIKNEKIYWVNLDDIAKQLYIHKNIICEYINLKLGSNFLTPNGQIKNQTDLSICFNDFMRLFIYCKECKSSDTFLSKQFKKICYECNNSQDMKKISKHINNIFFSVYDA